MTDAGASMEGIAITPKPPYVAVIFTSLRTEGDQGYGETADELAALCAAQPGFLGMEHAREAGGVGITICYWRSLEDVVAWKKVAEHAAAQESGRAKWYRAYRVRICEVQREYGFEREG